MNEPLNPKKRIEAIDAFRGFTIFAMIFVIMVAGYSELPFAFPQFDSVPVSTFKHAGEDDGPTEWERWEQRGHSTSYRLAKVVARTESIHAYDVALVAGKEETGETFKNQRVWTAKPLHEGEEIVAVFEKGGESPTFQQRGIGCTFTDWVAPFFVFIVGLCIPLSRGRRGVDWWKHVGLRTVGLILAGVLYISLAFRGLSWWWGILQAIGIAYFMGAASMMLPKWGRWVLVFAIVLFHSWATWHIPWWVELGQNGEKFWTIVNQKGDKLRPLMVHCTPWGSISYGICTIIGTLLGEAIATRNTRTIVRQSLILGVVFTLLGYLLHLHLPMHKDIVSASYSLFTSGIGALCFLLFFYLIDVLGAKAGWVAFLNVFGANALLAYFMQPIVRIILQTLGLYQYLGGRSGWEGMFAGLVWTMILWCVVLVCNKRGIFWKL